jgi:glycine hydroxymethyltransferase
MSEEYRNIMKQVALNAKTLAKELSNLGFRIVTGGTDNHIVMVDLRPKNITGKQLDEALESVGITVNKNMIPNDPESPMVTSGVRIGTTAMTIKGAKEKEMKEIAYLIDEVAESINKNKDLNDIKVKVKVLANKFTLYEENL